MRSLLRDAALSVGYPWAVPGYAMPYRASRGYRWAIRGMPPGYPWANLAAIVRYPLDALAIVVVRGRVRLPFVGAGPCRVGLGLAGLSWAIRWLSQGYISIHHG